MCIYRAADAALTERRLRIYLHCSSSSSCLRHPVGERARKKKAAAMADNCDPVLPTSFEVLSYRCAPHPHLPCHIPFSFSQVNRGPSKNLNANLGSSRSGCQWLCLCLPALVDDGFFPALSVLSTRPIARSLCPAKFCNWSCNPPIIIMDRPRRRADCALLGSDEMGAPAAPVSHFRQSRTRFIISCSYEGSSALPAILCKA